MFVGLAAFVVVGLLTWHAIRPRTFVALNPRLTPSEHAALIAKLDVNATPYKLDGSLIWIPSEQYECLRVDLSHAGLLTGQDVDRRLGSSGSNNEFAYQREVEQHLAAKAQDILDHVFGRGKALVCITAELKYQHFQEQTETYSSDGRVLVEEQISNSKSTEQEQLPDDASEALNQKTILPISFSTSAVTPVDESAKSKWQVPKTNRLSEQRFGQVDRLAVAVMLIQEQPTEGAGDQAAQRINRDEAAKLVKQAVGFKEHRDTLQITVGIAPHQGRHPHPPSIPLRDLLRNAALSFAAALAAFTVLVAVWLLFCNSGSQQAAEVGPAATFVGEVRQESNSVALTSAQPSVQAETVEPSSGSTTPAADEQQVVDAIREFPREVDEVRRDSLEGPQFRVRTTSRLADTTSKPVDPLQSLSPVNIARVLQHEHPRAIAIALNKMEARQASEVIKRLEPTLCEEVFLLMTKGLPENSGIVQRVVQTVVDLCAKAEAVEPKVDEGSQFEHLADVLQHLDHDQRGLLLHALQSASPDAFAEIESRLYRFEDLLKVPDYSLKAILAECDLKVLATALDHADSLITERVMMQISERVRNMLRQEIEFLGSVTPAQVDAARREIVDIIRQHDRAPTFA